MREEKKGLHLIKSPYIHVIRISLSMARQTHLSLTLALSRAIYPCPPLSFSLAWLHLLDNEHIHGHREHGKTSKRNEKDDPVPGGAKDNVSIATGSKRVSSGTVEHCRRIKCYAGGTVEPVDRVTLYLLGFNNTCRGYGLAGSGDPRQLEVPSAVSLCLFSRPRAIQAYGIEVRHAKRVYCSKEAHLVDCVRRKPVIIRSEWLFDRRESIGEDASLVWSVCAYGCFEIVENQLTLFSTFFLEPSKYVGNTLMIESFESRVC